MDIKHFPEWLSTVRGKHCIIILVNNQSISTHYLMVSITSDKIYKMGFYLKGFTLIIIFCWFFYPSFIQSLLSCFLIHSSFIWLLTYPLPFPPLVDQSWLCHKGLTQSAHSDSASPALRLSMDTFMNSSKILIPVI